MRDPYAEQKQALIRILKKREKLRESNNKDKKEKREMLQRVVRISQGRKGP